MKQDRKYYIRLTLLSLLLFALVIVYDYLAPDAATSRVLWYIVPFFFIVQVVSRFFIRRFEKKTTHSIKMLHLAVSGIKLFIYITVLVLYGFFVRIDIPQFFIGFLLLYLIYTWFDVHNQLKLLSG